MGLNSNVISGVGALPFHLEWAISKKKEKLMVALTQCQPPPLPAQATQRHTNSPLPRLLCLGQPNGDLSSSLAQATRHHSPHLRPHHQLQLRQPNNTHSPPYPPAHVSKAAKGSKWSPCTNVPTACPVKSCTKWLCTSCLLAATATLPQLQLVSCHSTPQPTPAAAWGWAGPRFVHRAHHMGLCVRFRVLLLLRGAGVYTSPVTALLWLWVCGVGDRARRMLYFPLAQHWMSSICLAPVTHHVIMVLPAAGFGAIAATPAAH